MAKPKENLDSFWEKAVKNSKSAAIRNLLLSGDLDSRHPEVLAERNEHDLHAIVYKIDSLNQKHRLHEIAFFIKNDNQYFNFSHSYNLSALADKYCTTNKAALQIRQLGDEVLHTEAVEVTDFSDTTLQEVNQQLNVLKEVLYVTGGVGIAANQCLEIKKPFKIVIAGVDYQNPEHTIKAITRYPSALFPQLQVYINPVVVEVSNETDIFPEGCLSMQGTLRALVSRPKDITVRYQDMTGKQYVRRFTGTDARVMQHEVDHINNGKVYIQRVIEELSTDQLATIVKLAKEIKPEKENNSASKLFTTPKLIFNRDETGKIIFDVMEVTAALKEMPPQTLLSFHTNIASELSDRK